MRKGMLVLLTLSSVLLVPGCGGGGGGGSSSSTTIPGGSGSKSYTTVTTFGSLGTGNGQFTEPAGVSLTPSGDVLVADSAFGRIEVFTASGTFVGQLGSEGTAPGQLQAPTQAVSANNNFFVVDPAGNQVVEYGPDFSYIKTLDASAVGGFKTPSSIAATPDGTLYIGVSGAILVFSATGQYERSITSVNGKALSPGGVTALTADSSGNLYTVDPANLSAVDKFSPTGTFISQISTPATPNAIAVDPQGNLFLTDLAHQDIQEYSPTGALISTVAQNLTVVGIAVTSTDTVYAAIYTTPGGHVDVFKP